MLVTTACSSVISSQETQNSWVLSLTALYRNAIKRVGVEAVLGESSSCNLKLLRKHLMLIFLTVPLLIVPTKDTRVPVRLASENEGLPFTYSQ